MTSIAQERARLAAVGQRLRWREEWISRRAYTDARAVTEPATRVFVHITITNPSNYSSEDAHARAVEAIGIARFPATGISYNRGFMQSGRAYEFQPIGRRGAHTVNDFRRSTCTTSGCPGRGGPLTAPDWNLNYNSRAYVICQNVGDAVTDAQLDQIARAIAADMLAGFVTRSAEIHGHRCVSSKSCPGDRMWARMGELRNLVDHYLDHGLIEPEPAKGKHVLFIAKGASVVIMIVGDRALSLTRTDGELIAAKMGLPIISGVSTAGIALIQQNLGSEQDAPEPLTP